VNPPPIYYALFHTPGPNWAAGVGFREQPGVVEHVQYMAQFQETGQMVIGGPFLDDTGGMMVLEIESQEAAEEIATADPSVKSGLLAVEVKPWMVVFSR
jgi:uncharacterized protein YciI